MGYFDKLKELGGKAVNAADKFAGATNDMALKARKVAEGKKNAQQQEALGEQQFPFLGYVFYPGGGVGLKTTFFADYIEHSGDKVPYSDIRTVEVTHLATNNFTNGTAQATLMSGKILTFAVKTSDMSMFLQAVGYANDRINEIHGGENGYKFGFQANDGTAIEIYDDYLILKLLGDGLVGRTEKKALSFKEIGSVSAVPADQEISIILQITGGSQITLLIPEYYGQRAQDAANYILQRKTELDEAAAESESVPPVAWQPFDGEEKEFSLNGAKLIIPKEMDLYNSYRLKFRDVASEYTALAKEQYGKKVHDLDSFILFFMDIYTPYLDKMVQGAVDILIAEGVWTETFDSLKAAHVNSFHLALDDYNTMKKSLNLTDQNNRQAAKRMTDAVPTLQGGGFGLRGAMKGIAKAEAFNFVRNTAANAVQNATQVTPAQKAELFGRINTDALFNRVLADYWNVCQTLINKLVKNGKRIWLQDNAATAQAENVSKNLSNPNFPQDKVTEVIIQILQTCPFKKEFHRLLHDKCGDSEETKLISEYFGYADY